MTTTTPYLGLKVDDNLTVNAKYNLAKLDLIGASYYTLVNGDIKIRSKKDMYFEPESAALGGNSGGELGNVYMGSASQHLESFTVYADAVSFTVISLADTAVGGTKKLHLAYKSDSGDVTPETTADRTLYIDVNGADRELSLAGFFKTTNNVLFTSAGAVAVTLPPAGTLATLAESETFTNKIIDSDLNEINNIRNADIAADAAIAYSKLNLSLSVVNADVAANAAITYSKLYLSNSLVNADVATNAAIVYSKLVLTDSIVDADVAATAAIAGSKIVPNFGTQNIITSGYLKFNSGSYSQTIRANSGAQASYDLYLPVNAPGAGQLLSSAANGVLSWASIASSNLAEHYIDVGNVSSIRTQVDTSSLGDIEASTTDGLLVKSDVLDNANIKSDAAIAHSKMAALTASKALVSGTGGVVEVSTTTAAEIGYVAGVTSAIQSQINGKEPANLNIQSHIGSTANPHAVTYSQVGAEPANLNIQSHIGDASIHFTQGAISIPASQISDFDTEVSNNSDVSANTSARHAAVTVVANNSLSIIGQQLTFVKPSNIVTVAASGADYTTISAALAAITTATYINQFSIHLSPGLYAEDIVLKPFVNIVGDTDGAGAPIIMGKISCNFLNVGELCVLNRLQVVRAIAVDGEVVCDLTGTILINDFWMSCSTTSNYGFTALKMNSGGALVNGNINCTSTFDGSTKDIIGVDVYGTNPFASESMTISLTVAAASGSIVARRISSTGYLFLQNSQLLTEITRALFAGEVCCSRILAPAAANTFRISQAECYRTQGISGGTSIGMCLNTGSTAGEMYYVGAAFFSNGFTNEYICNTTITDTHKIWLQSVNKDLGFSGLGLAMVTPYTEAKSGFNSWSQDPTITTYWTYTPGTLLFKVDKRGTGFVKGAPVRWEKDQTVTLTNLATNYVYVDSSGILNTTVTPAVLNFEQVIFLFEVYVEGTNYIVVKENHPYKFTSSISAAWHNLFGALLQDASQTLAINSAANRTTNLVGTNTLTDHGLDTPIAPQTPMTITQCVTNTSTGIPYILATQSGLITRKSAANTTGTIVANGRRLVFRLGVIKDSLNSTTPQFITIADSLDYNSNSAAANAIASGIVLPFPTKIKELEICQLGFITVTADGAAAGTTAAVTTALQVFGAQFVSGGTSTSAGLITTSLTNFDGILSGADTTVQLALDTIDSHAATTDTTHANITSHVADASIHFAQSAISIPASQISDFDTEVSNNTNVSAATSHIGASTGVHGISGAVVGTTDVQTITNKDIDGGTASDSLRITIPKNTTANLNALTRKEGTIVFDSTTKIFKYDNGTTLVSGGGDVAGAASSTDNAIVRFDSVSGKLIQNSVVTIDDAGAATGFTTIGASTSVNTPTILTTVVKPTSAVTLNFKNYADGVVGSYTDAGAWTFGPSGANTNIHTFNGSLVNKQRGGGSTDGFKLIAAGTNENTTFLQDSGILYISSATNAAPTTYTITAQMTQAGVWTFGPSGGANSTINATVLGALRVAGSLIAGTSGNGYPSIGYNAKNTTTANVWEYAVGDTAAWIRFGASGGMTFYTAASGTGGATISPTTIADVTQAGAWTFGPTSFTGTHTFKGYITETVLQTGGGNEIRLLPNQDSDGDVYWGYGGYAGGATRGRGTFFCGGKNNVLGGYTQAGAWTFGPTTGTASGQHLIGGHHAGYILKIENRNTSDICEIKTALTSGASSIFNFLDGDNASGGNISLNTTANTTTYGTTSDSRLKHLPESFNALELIRIGQPKQYERICDPGTKEIGFFAQELYEVYPQAVQVGGEDPTKSPWQVDYAKVTPILWKAIQEQQIIIEELKLRLAALESK